MSRYIDAEELKDTHYNYATGELVPLAWADIENAPHIDIVRCKECRHWIGETEYYEDREYKACWQLCGQYTDSEFWCKYGEREGE